MADINKSVDIGFKTNADIIKSSVDGLLNSLDKTSDEYNELEIAVRSLEEAERALLNSEKKLTEDLGRTKGATSSLKAEVIENTKAYQNKLNELNKIRNRYQEVNTGSTQLNTSTKSLTTSVLDNGGAMGILNELTGGVAMTFKDAAEASDLFGNSSVRALNATKAALISIGIGALVVALAAIVTYWDDIKGAVDGVTPELKLQEEYTTEIALQSKDELDSLLASENTLKLKGLSEKEILRLKKEQTNQVIAETAIQLQAIKATNEAAQRATLRNFNIVKSISETLLNISTAPIRVIALAADGLITAFNKITGDSIPTANQQITKLVDSLADAGTTLIFDPSKTKEEGEKEEAILQKSLQNLINTRDGYQLAINKIDTDASTKRTDDAQKAREEEAKKIQEQSKALLEIKKKQNEDEVKNRTDALNRITTAEKLAMEQRYEDEQKAKDLESERVYNEQKNIIIEESINRQKLAEEQLAQVKRDALDTGLDILGSFAGKNKSLALGILAVQKGLAISDVVVNTAKALAGITSGTALASVQAFAQLGPIAGAPVAAGIQAAGLKSALATKISAVTQIATIAAAGLSGAKQISSGGSSNSNNSVSTGQASAQPNVSFVTSNENQIATSINRTQNEQPPVRAYVVSQDVTTAQSLDRNLVDSSTL